MSKPDLKLPWTVRIVDLHEGGGKCYEVVDTRGWVIFSTQTYYPECDLSLEEMQEVMRRLGTGEVVDE